MRIELTDAGLRAQLTHQGAPVQLATSIPIDHARPPLARGNPWALVFLRRSCQRMKDPRSKDPDRTVAPVAGNAPASHSRMKTGGSLEPLG